MNQAASSAVMRATAPLEGRFAPPMPARPREAPANFGVLKALRTDVLDLWPEAAYRDDYHVTSIFGRRLILLNAPDGIQHVITTNDQNYRRSPIRVRLLRPVLGDGLVLSEGEAWRHQRRTAAPAFAPRAMPVIAPHFATVAEKAVGYLQGAAAGEVDLRELMHRWAIELAARSMFSFADAEDMIAIETMLEDYTRRFLRPYPLDVLMPMSVPSPHDILRRRFQKKWMRLVGRMVTERLKTPPPETPVDFFDLLRAARDPEGGAAFAPDQLRDQVATMLVAGHETPSIAMFWSCYLLASAPEHQDAVAAEVAGLDLSPWKIAEALPKLVYTRAVASEAMRLYPPAFMIVRVAKKDDRWNDLDIPEGSTVMVAPWVLHRHEKFWKDAALFDPTRFLPGAPPPQRMTYLPFGTGPRVCIGAQFATTMITTMLASVIKAFRVELADSRPVLPACVATAHPDHHPPFRLTAR